MNKYALTNEDDIVKQIEQADEIQLNKIIRAVMYRYNVLHTDREAAFLSLPTDPHARDAELENIVHLIRFCDNRRIPNNFRRHTPPGVSADTAGAVSLHKKASNHMVRSLFV